MKYTFSKARSFASAAIMVASLLFMATAFLGCEDEQKKAFPGNMSGNALPLYKAKEWFAVKCPGLP